MNHKEETDLMKKIGKEIRFKQKILFFVCSIVALFFPGFTVVVLGRSIKNAIDELSLDDKLSLQQFIEEIK